MFLPFRGLGPDEFGAVCSIMAIGIPATRWRLFRQLLADTTPAARHKLWRVSFLLLFSPGAALLAAALFLRRPTLMYAAIPIVAVAWCGMVVTLLMAVFRNEDLVE